MGSSQNKHRSWTTDRYVRSASPSRLKRWTKKLARLRKEGLQGRSKGGSRHCGSLRLSYNLLYLSYKTYADIEMLKSPDCQRGPPAMLAFKEKISCQLAGYIQT